MTQHHASLAPGQQTTRASPVSAMLRSVCLKAHMMELITSCSCCGDKVYSVSKQLLVIALSRLKNCSRCSGKSCREGCSSVTDPGLIWPGIL